MNQDINIASTRIEDIDKKISDYKKAIEELEAQKENLLKYEDSIGVSSTEMESVNSVKESNQEVIPLEGANGISDNAEDIAISTEVTLQKTDNHSVNSIHSSKLPIEKTIALPNGKVGVEYCCIINDKYFPHIDTNSIIIVDLEKTGLKFDALSKSIVGCPTCDGTFHFDMKFKLLGSTNDKPLFERQISIVVNPDPKSLWKDIPTPDDIEYFKPDYISDFVKVESVKEGGFLGINKKIVPQKDIVAASVRGRSHAHEGKARDDEFKISYDSVFEWYFISVADGAGSAKFSRKGSQIACETVQNEWNKSIKSTTAELEPLLKNFKNSETNEVRKQIGDTLYKSLGHAVFYAHKAIHSEAQAKGVQLKDYSTTFITAIAKKFDFGWFIAAYWVGDGGVGIYDPDNGYLKILGETDEGEYAGQTRFITMPDMIQASEIYRRLRFVIVPDFKYLVLMTDGITDPMFETDANLNRIEKWDELFASISSNVSLVDDNVESQYQLLKWLGFWSQGNHDDRTIAILF